MAIDYALNYADMFTAVSSVLEAKLVPFITSAPGQGKSALVKDLANKYNMELIDIRLSMLEPTDIQGIPNFNSKGEAYFAPFNIFPLESTPLPEGKEAFLLFCHHKDTEVLTKDSGFVKFSELPKDALVAQYDMVTHAISYAKPEAYIEYHKKGRLVFNEGDSVKYAITEDHDLILQTKLRHTSSNQLTYKRKPLEASISASLQMPLAGYNEQGWKDALTYDDKLAIAFQADGSFTWEHADGESCSISFGFSKARKIEQFRKDFPQAKETVCGDMTHFSMRKIPKQHLSKRLRDVFKPSDFTVEGCRAFLQYVKLWDGFTAGSGYGYGSTIWDNCSVVQEFAILSGQKCNIGTQVDNRKDTFSNYHKCHWYPKDACTTQALRSQTVNDYDDMVYCLKMPKGTLVTRYKGSVLISGNCDEFNAASKQTAAAAYKLVLDRQVGNYNLHPDCYIVCAGNRSSDRAITNNLGTALQTRLIHLSLEVEYQDWMDTVAIPQKYDYRITSFLAQYPALLNNFNPEHTVNTYAVPRTWEFTNRLIKDKEITPLHSAVLAGTIGTEVALQFIQYSKVYEGLPTIASIVADPATALLPTDTPSKWAILSLLLENANEENIGMFAMYSERFGMDLRVYFLRCIAKQHPTLMRHPKLSETIMELSRYLHS